jgi:uncharacterized protein YfaP (DUF2135 family)
MSNQMQVYELMKTLSDMKHHFQRYQTDADEIRKTLRLDLKWDQAAIQQSEAEISAHLRDLQKFLEKLNQEKETGALSRAF